MKISADSSNLIVGEVKCGTKIMTEQIASLQLYLESEKAIHMDQATWERTNG